MTINATIHRNKRLCMRAFILPFLYLGSVLVLFSSCQNKPNDIVNLNVKYITPIDSLQYDYKNSSLSEEYGKRGYDEDIFGSAIRLDSNNEFIYYSINSKKEFHEYHSQSGIHTYSAPITTESIRAFLVTDSLLFLLYNDTLHVKDLKLNAKASFPYRAPYIELKHGIDFDGNQPSNLFIVNDYYVLMYYVVHKGGKGSVYRNTKLLFYYFNSDTSFFANKMCTELDTSFQYFRYPVVISDGNYLYHAPRVMNCISKSNESGTFIHKPIDIEKNRYLTFSPQDQYEISKVKKYRFTSDYNEWVLTDKENVYLLRTFASKIYHSENNVREYERDLEVIKYDKNLKEISRVFIEIDGFSNAIIRDKKLYLFKTNNNIAYVYEI